ncbi:hypothetical protein [Bacillus sp. Marseille-P3661]|uniref:hypothetical protein n=1 Tax=Bacillus sp. Marseille-P3661 TaxID=1936234 RepID=UPI000C826D97|nr:hypothetical protein [Bacillus sp. Marseille-P3661]
MEFNLKGKDGAFPCEVTLDEDNGRYMLRKADTSGEYFNEPQQLVQWIEENWTVNDFKDPEEFNKMIREIRKYL